MSSSLCSPELDGLDWVGQIDREVFRLVGLNKRSKHVQTVAVGYADVGVALHQPGDFLQRSFIIGFGSDRADVHDLLHFHGFGIDLVVLGVSADEFDVNNAEAVRYCALMSASIRVIHSAAAFRVSKVRVMLGWPVLRTWA